MADTVPQRQLGRQGLMVSALGQGCMGRSGFYTGGDAAGSIATIRCAHAGHPISALQTECSLWRRSNPRFQGDNFRKNLALTARIGEIAGEHDVTAAQVALAWLLAQGKDIVPVTGTKRRTFLEENAAALNMKLSAGDLERVRNAFPRRSVAGACYAGMQPVDL